jgi:3-oxoacyl-[acyl-carrier protein] reductase
MINPNLQDKVVVVTGANNPHGVGAATACAFAEQGARVFLTYLRVANYATDERTDDDVPGRGFYSRQQVAPIEPVLDAIRAAGGRAEAWEADLARGDVIAELFDRTEASFGPVDVLVSNAAYCVADTFLPPALLKAESRSSGQTSMQSLDPGTLDQHFAVNTRGTALLMAEYARRHAARAATWGRIVNVSTDGADCFPSEVSYGASKHAMESYSRSAAVELGPLGITVNVVSLGMVQTGWVSDAVARDTAARYPLRRIGQPDDVADVIVFLASEQARWVTGQLLYVGGGHITPR